MGGCSRDFIRTFRSSPLHNILYLSLDYVTTKTPIEIFFILYLDYIFQTNALRYTMIKGR